MLEQDHALVICDARCHGLSEAPHGDWSGEDLAADQVAFIQVLGLGQPTRRENGD